MISVGHSRCNEMLVKSLDMADIKSIATPLDTYRNFQCVRQRKMSIAKYLKLQYHCQWTLQYQFPVGNTDVSDSHTWSRHDLHSQHLEPINTNYSKQHCTATKRVGSVKSSNQKKPSWVWWLCQEWDEWILYTEIFFQTGTTPMRWKTEQQCTATKSITEYKAFSEAM